jgi:hypothetical protein
MSRLQKDEDGRVFFFDNTMMPAGGPFMKFLMGEGPDPRICYLDNMCIMAEDDEPCHHIDPKFGIRWKKQYTLEQIEKMYQEDQLKQEVEQYGVTKA